MTAKDNPRRGDNGGGSEEDMTASTAHTTEPNSGKPTATDQFVGPEDVRDDVECVHGLHAREIVTRARAEEGIADPTVVASAYLSSFLGPDGYAAYTAYVTASGLDMAETFDEAAAVPVSALPSGVAVTRAEVRAFCTANGVPDPHDAVAEARRAKSARERVEQEKAAQADPSAAVRELFGGPPIPLRSRALPDFPLDTLGEPYCTFVTEVARFTQTDPAMAATVLLGTLATVTQGCVEVEVRRGWVEPLSLFTVVIADPSERKSPVFKAVTRPVIAAERRLVEQSEGDRAEMSTRIEIARRQVEAAMREASNPKTSRVDSADGQDPLTAPVIDSTAEAVRLAREARELVMPPKPQLWVDDVTSEALAAQLDAHGGRASVMSDEGGVFRTILGRYSKGAANLDIYLKGYSGDAVRIDRADGRSIALARPAVSLVLAVQPVIIEAVCKDELFVRSGFMARIAFVRPPSRIGSRAVNQDPIDEKIEREYHRQIEALTEALAEKYLTADPAMLTFTDDAHAVVVRLEREIEARLGPSGDLHGSRMSDWVGKHVGRVVRIAGVLHLGEHGASGVDHPIDASTVERAARIGDYLLAHTSEVFGTIDTAGSLDDALGLLKVIRRMVVKEGTYEMSTRAVVGRGPKSIRKGDDADPALALLQRYRYVLREERKPIGGGRARNVLIVNPDQSFDDPTPADGSPEQ